MISIYNDNRAASIWADNIKLEGKRNKLS